LRRLVDGGGLVTHPQLVFPEDLTVDLTDCGYLGPMAVVGLAVLRRVAETQGRQVCIVPPSLERLYNYCRYSGLLAEFGAGPAPDVGHPRNVTRPLAFFDTQTPRHDIGQIVQLAQSEMALTEAGKGDLKLTLGEVTQNVIDHSRSTVGGALSARAYADKKEVRFAVADAGVSFQGALEKNGIKARSPKDALRKVFIDKLSSQSRTHNMGQGLQHLHHIVRLSAGRLVIFSGAGVLDVQRSKNFFRDTDVAFPGTMVFVKLPIRPDAPGAEPQPTFWDG
jgi:hypothetical protein